MQGDQQDMLFRMKQLLPLRWFPDDTPVLDTILSGTAWVWSWAYGLLQYAKAQTRISTAQDTWLDLISWDYFGSRFLRRPQESDNDFRQRIRQELFRERGTRNAVLASLTDLTGRLPILFEPSNAHDTGGYGGTNRAYFGLAYGCSGGWGSLQLPFQFLVCAFRPSSTGNASMSGWGEGAGGYCEGSIAYGSLAQAQAQAQITDSAILRTISDVIPVGTIAWTRILS